MSDTPPAKKQKRTRLSLQDKAEAARLLKNGSDAQDVMRKFNVSRRTVSNLKASTEQLLRQADDGLRSLDLKTFRTARVPQLDTKMLQFVTFARSAKLSLSYTDLQERALYIRERLLREDDDSNPSYRSTLSQFTASKGWADNFSKRHVIRATPLGGDAFGPLTETGAKELDTLHEQLRAFNPDCIYRVEEITLFFKLFPRKMYTMFTEDDKQVWSNDACMGPHDRVSVYLCTNTSGSDKVPIAIIGRPGHADVVPTKMDGSNSAARFLKQEQAWSDGTTLRSWFVDVFEPHVRSVTSNPIALVLERGMPIMGKLRGSGDQINVITLPTACVGPTILARMTLADLWRICFRREMMRAIVRRLDRRVHLRSLNSGLREELRGLQEGYEPHVMDLMVISRDAWAAVSNASIAQWWMKSHVLPVEVCSHLYTTYGVVGGLDKKFVVQEILGSVQRIINWMETGPGKNDAYLRHVEDVTENDIEKWLTIEDDREVAKVLVNDEIERAEQVERSAMSQSASLGSESSSGAATVLVLSSSPVTDRKNGTNGLGNLASKTLLPMSDIHSLLSNLMNLAFECDVPGALDLLHDVKESFLEAQLSRGVANGTTGTDSLFNATGIVADGSTLNGIDAGSVPARTVPETTTRNSGNMNDFIEAGANLGSANAVHLQQNNVDLVIPPTSVIGVAGNSNGGGMTGTATILTETGTATANALISDSKNRLVQARNVSDGRHGDNVDTDGNSNMNGVAMNGVSTIISSAAVEASSSETELAAAAASMAAAAAVATEASMAAATEVETASAALTTNSVVKTNERSETAQRGNNEVRGEIDGNNETTSEVQEVYVGTVDQHQHNGAVEDLDVDVVVDVDRKMAEIEGHDKSADGGGNSGNCANVLDGKQPGSNKGNGPRPSATVIEQLFQPASKA